MNRSDKPIKPRNRLEFARWLVSGRNPLVARVVVNRLWQACFGFGLDRPTLGAWLSYGLGSENQDLPAYIVLTSGSDDGQPLLQSFWGNGFMESRHQGVPFRNSGDPILHLANPANVSKSARREQLDLLRWMNQRQHGAMDGINPRVVALMIGVKHDHNPFPIMQKQAGHWPLNT